MAADSNSVKRELSSIGGARADTGLDGRHPELVQPGITGSELLTAVGNLELPGDGFADALEVVQASQPLAEMPEWPD